MTSLIRFQDVYRDAIQSLMGTNPSADQIIQAYEDAPFTGVDSIQVAGGTFYDLFAKKGRDEWAELERICGFFKNKGVKLSALIRGDFLFTYEPQSYDVIYATVLEHAKLGINILQNFHGENDARCLVGVAKAVKEIREKYDYDIVAQGTICVEDKPGTNSDAYIESLVEYAKELVEMGHEGIYIKSASGRLDADMIYKLMGRLYTELPDQKMTIHAHSTYGEAPICYMAAARAAVEHGKEITMDVQNPALAGSTAHPSMLKMLSLIKNHPLKAMRDNAPKLDIDVIKESMSKLFAMRFLFRDFESTYNPRLLEAMRKARTPGGASATLKSIPGLVENLGRLLGTDDWDEIQIAIYEMQAEILDDLGQPTQVTPYAANTTGQAAISLANILQAKALVIEGESEEDRAQRIEEAKYQTLLHGDDLSIVNYLIGKHGRVSDSVNPELVQKAVAQYNKQAKMNGKPTIDGPVDYVLSMDREPALPTAYEAIKAVKEVASKLSAKRSWGHNKPKEKSVIEEPTQRQAISAVLLKGGVKHVIDCFRGENKPIANPKVPFYAEPPANENSPRYRKDGVEIVDVRDAVRAIGGIAKIQEIAERCLHLKQLNDELYHFSQSDKDLNQKWYEGNIQHLAELIDEIPELLKKEGFTHSQTLSALHSQGASNLMACIRDACDNKGVGLYDHMMKAIDEYKTQMAIEASPDNIVVLKRNARVSGSSGSMTGTDGPVYAY